MDDMKQNLRGMTKEDNEFKRSSFLMAPIRPLEFVMPILTNNTFFSDSISVWSPDGYEIGKLMAIIRLIITITTHTKVTKSNTWL